ncbi:MAG: efflux RND transporter periplasmic adaptor subunit [Gemmataceae bacterium]|nr:efflux RND transporter periplasmic adaptor subunit [Gemmataceae bacterium]
MSDPASTSVRPPVTPAPAPTPPEEPSFWSRLFGMVPTLLALGLLATVGAWGYFHDWKIPKFGELLGEKEEEDKDWCEQHSVPQSICVECQDREAKRQPPPWCAVHGVHDCPFENPKVAQLPNNPQLDPADLARSQQALAFKPRPENDSKWGDRPRRLQFPSREAFERMAITVQPVKRGRVVEYVSAAGEIHYEHTKIARLSARLPGTVWRVCKQLGEPVKKDEVVALIDSAEVGRARTEYLQAISQLALRELTLKRLEQAGTTPEARMFDAVAAVQEGQLRLLTAEQVLGNLGLPVRTEEWKGLPPAEVARRLHLLGLPDSVAKTLDARGTTANLLPVMAPLDGVVVAREAVVGEVTDPTRVLLTVSDTREMCLELYVRQEEMTHVKIGRKVLFRPDAFAKDEEDQKGTISWISPGVDDKTRTVRVRAHLQNPHGRLRSHTFGSGRIIVRAEDQGIVVPARAVHWDGSSHVVFVQDRDFEDREAKQLWFHVRSVRVGARDEEQTEIIAGVLPGERVAVEGSGLLANRLRKVGAEE